MLMVFKLDMSDLMSVTVMFQKKCDALKSFMKIFL